MPQPSANVAFASAQIPVASEIIPRLYISDISAAENPAVLRALGITHVLSAMRGTVALPPAGSWPLMRAMQVQLEDNPFAELAAHLPATTAFVREALRDPSARVLVHCVQGVSRSASVVCAFLIAHYGWSPAQAVQYVKSKRASAEPNFGFVGQLQEYADKLRSGAFA
ncbi:phosphotyrosine protein [Punctularia strigosozonata HHB-11173 SS5]|uniref:phosphotyrosine protein n=1 Tax=Punctularia strigosozonata (strain HHB-11173) TaxID=741275 RepID=UPI000441678B|nr:phosphotyrosine protein [Punctularia strigosozonata HHB-11173 SS5]EIN07020.1 phosphotyrosine protein [Punctularia strigosozonata HHB-11173 SS5]